MGFGKQLKIVLDTINLSIADLSKITDIPASTIYSIIDRDSDNVGLDKVKKIEKAIRAIPGGILYNLLYGIEDEDVSTRQHDFYAVGEESREVVLEEKYQELNAKGQVKVVEYAEDLTKIPEYRSNIYYSKKYTYRFYSDELPEVDNPEDEE